MTACGRGLRRCAARTLWITSVVLALAGTATAAPVTVTPSFSVNEEYNDNIFFNQNHTEDYITSLHLGLIASYLRPDLTALLSTGTSARFFARGVGTNTLDLAEATRGNLSTAYQASSRLSLGLSDSIARVGRTRGLSSTTITDLGTTDSTAANTVTTSNTDLGGVSVLLPRGNALSNSFGVTAGYLLTPLVSSSVAYTNTLFTFSDPGGTNLTSTGSLGLGYEWSPTFGTNVGYSYSRFDSNVSADADTHTVTLGANYQLSPEWSVNGTGGGFVNRQYASGTTSTPTRTGATFDLGLTRAFEWSRLTVRGRQGITPSAGVAGTSITREGLLSYYVLLAQKLRGSLTTSYSPFDTSQGSFQVFQLYTGISYTVWENVSAGLFYAYRRSDAGQAVGSTLAAGTIDSNVVRLQISMHYPLWRGDL